MKKFLILILAALLAIGMLLTACDKDNEITDPAEADWSVAFVRTIDSGKDATHFVTVSWAGEENEFVAPNSLTLKVDGEELPLQVYNEVWFGDATLVSGQTYDIELIIDGETACDGSLTMVNEVSGSFPATYDPSSSATISWAVSGTGNNDSQIVSATSYDPVNFTHDSFDEVLTPSARSYTFPAEAVESYGADTMYSLEITEMNAKTVSDVMLISSHGDDKDYPEGKGFSSLKALIGQNLRLARLAR